LIWKHKLEKSQTTSQFHPRSTQTELPGFHLKTQNGEKLE